MIPIEDARDRFIIKNEKNGVNDGVSTDNFRFCVSFNEAQNKYMSISLQNRKVDDIRYIEKFLILDKELIEKEESSNRASFKLPNDYFDVSSARCKAITSSCSGILDLIEVAPDNLPYKLTNSYTKPSFEWRESIYTINSGYITVFTDNFKVEKTLLNYYRYPNQIRLVDNNNPESNFDSQYSIEWDDKSLDEIITLMVINYKINESDPTFQMNLTRFQK